MIINTLKVAYDVNIEYVILMDVVLGFLYLFNILLGTIIGTHTSKFDAKKFVFGFVKAICVLVIIVGVCYILNVFTLTINQIENINIGTELISTLEMLTILITQGIDLAKEVIEKIKTFRDLKYIKYEDVKQADSIRDMLEG